jgi:anaerobic magnesium-protoporphyrin IX monomethyl ester cyclase
VLLWFKFTELVVQLRPKALARVLFHPDRGLRHAMRWYTKMGRRVWPHEVFGFLFRDKRTAHGPSVAQFWGRAQDDEEESMVLPQKREPSRLAALS